MSKTVLSEYSKLLLSIYRSAQELPVEEFQDAILNAIKPYLPFDSSMWGTATMESTGIDIHSLHLHNTSMKMIEAYEKVKHLDTAAAKVTSQPRATIGFNTDTDFNDPELADYRRFLKEHQHNQFFITSDINPITKFVHWVSLYRNDPNAVCTETETELLAYLAPHLMQALAINRLVHLDKLTGDVAREIWCVAIVDVKGVIYHADKRFRELVGTEWPALTKDNLPGSLIQQLLGEDSTVAGKKVVIRRNLEHGLLFLKARERAPVDNLSTREYIVAKLLASGLSQKEVASRLERSPETIRSQVKVIFTKLGIKSATLLPQHLALRD